MARSKESYQLAAANANVTKWSKAISKVNDDKPIYEVLGVNEVTWNGYSPSERLSLIKEWKQGKDIKLPSNKKSREIIDVKNLAYQLVDPNATPAQRELATKNISILMAYDKAKQALNEAEAVLKEAQANYDKAKANYKQAESDMKKSNLCK